jgi:hypothetical protein
MAVRLANAVKTGGLVGYAGYESGKFKGQILKLKIGHLPCKSPIICRIQMSGRSCARKKVVSVGSTGILTRSFRTGRVTYSCGTAPEFHRIPLWNFIMGQKTKMTSVIKLFDETICLERKEYLSP